jgi:hypothetical protein
MTDAAYLHLGVSCGQGEDFEKKSTALQQNEHTSVTRSPLPSLSHRAYAVNSGTALSSCATSFSMMLPIRLYSWVLAGSGAALAAFLLLRRKGKGPDELERERREWLDHVGRITDGTVIDVQELSGNGNRPLTMLIFQYDVAGVSYEASQDVTYLRQLINLHSCRLGLPTSVRYDPQNPGNSIVISERWMGLRQ